MTSLSRAANTSSPHHLPPLICPKSVSPTRESVPAHEHVPRGPPESRGVPEPLGAARDRQDRQEKAARKRELARRQLSNSLQGMKTILPDLRRTLSFNVNAPKEPASRPAGPSPGLRRDTRSLGSRKPARDLRGNPWGEGQREREGVRRTHSLREPRLAGNNDPDPRLQHPLSRSLPHQNGLSLAALVRELNAGVHRNQRRHDSDDDDDDDDDDDTIDRPFEYENGLDPELCPRLTGQDPDEMPHRTLTPALRKLNRRRVSSRVRTQQWVNQIVREQRSNQRRAKDEAGTSDTENNEGRTRNHGATGTTTAAAAATTTTTTTTTTVALLYDEGT